MRITTDIQQRTRDLFRSKSVLGRAFPGANDEHFVCAESAEQHVRQGSLEFRLTLESFARPGMAGQGSTGRPNKAVAMRDRPSTTHMGREEKARFPPLLGRERPISRRFPKVEVNGTPMVAEMRKKLDTYARKTTWEIDHELCNGISTRTRLPRVRDERRERRTPFARQLPSASPQCKLDSPLELHYSLKKGVNKTGCFLLPPARTYWQLTDCSSCEIPPSPCLQRAEETADLTWEDFHSKNPACSQDVFLRCWSWLVDKYMQIPELKPCACHLQTLFLPTVSSSEFQELL
jgi:hypothetical protein